MVLKRRARARRRTGGIAQDPENQQLNFGKRLAHTDKIVRDRGFKTLKVWLQKHGDLDRLEFLKLWKGLFFAIWMADKRPVQQELAVNIALLMNDVPVAKQAMWLDTFWETMQASWENLDQHRLNKYLLFARIAVAEAFKVLRVNGWRIEQAQCFASTFSRGVPTDKRGVNVVSQGLVLQFLRVFWEELEPQLKLSPPPVEVVMELLEPFCQAAEYCRAAALVDAIHTHLFRRTPNGFMSAVLSRLRASVENQSADEKGREALAASVELLEKAATDQELAASLQPKKIQVPRYTMTMPLQKKSRRRKKKAAAGGDGAEKADDSCGVSPLLLPEAAVQSPEGKMHKKRRAADSASAEGAAEVLPPPAVPLASAPPEAAADAGPEATKPGRKKRRRGAAGAAAGDADGAARGPTSSAQPAEKRSVAFDLQATEVVKYSKQQRIASASAPEPAGEHARGALRNGKSSR